MTAKGDFTKPTWVVVTDGKTGAVIANALFDATGVRLFRLPLLPERVRQAIQTHKLKAGA